MKFRVSIAGIMTVVALVALDCMAIRSSGRLRAPMGQLLVIGVLPMANLLLAAMIRVRAGRRLGVTRPFRLGFAVAGTVALGVYVAFIVASPDAAAHAVDDPLAPLEPLGRWGTAGLATFIALALAWTQAPILAPALLGGWLYRRSRKRAASGHAAVPPRPLGMGGFDPVTTRLVDPAGSR